MQEVVRALERLQQASDILRRVSRFVILTRRLEVQLVEMNKGEPPEQEAQSSKAKLQVVTSPMLAVSDSVVPEIEDDKERAIAKAALTLAELS